MPRNAICMPLRKSPSSLREGIGEMMALRACIDASGGSGILTVSGIAFGHAQAVKANAKWDRVLRGRTFHMTDLNARRKDFVGVSDTEAHEIMVGLISILKQHASFMVAVSCDEAMISEAFPSEASLDRTSEKMRNAFRTPYGAMCHICMYAMSSILGKKRASPGRSIHYLLEAGDPGQRGVVDYLEHMVAYLPPDVRIQQYAMTGYDVVGKDEVQGIFHAADLLAWEWSRQVAYYRQNKPMRLSLKALVGGIESIRNESGVSLRKPGKFLMQHYDQHQTDRFVRFLREHVKSRDDTAIATNLDRWDASRPMSANQ